MSDERPGAPARALTYGEGAKKFGKGRAQAFMASLPADLAAREDKLPSLLRATNASRKSKLVKIYQLADEISAAREPFVACGKGCSHCCHMSIRLTSVEAERLGSEIGRAPARLAATKEREPEAFDGVPCPFLGSDHSCTIYAHRPLACRTHASFEADNSKCHPDVMNDDKVMLVNFSGLDEALFEVSAGVNGLVMADIRDFFPAIEQPAHTASRPER
jgi:uncharacterized protein